MKLMRAIAISLGLALFVSLSACKDCSAGLRPSQNPPQPPPGPNTGFVQDSNSNTPQENPPKTDTEPDGS